MIWNSNNAVKTFYTKMAIKQNCGRPGFINGDKDVECTYWLVERTCMKRQLWPRWFSNRRKRAPLCQKTSTSAWLYIVNTKRNEMEICVSCIPVLIAIQLLKTHKLIQILKWKSSVNWNLRVYDDVSEGIKCMFMCQCMCCIL